MLYDGSELLLLRSTLADTAVPLLPRFPVRLVLLILLVLLREALTLVVVLGDEFAELALLF